MQSAVMSRLGTIRMTIFMAVMAIVMSLYVGAGEAFALGALTTPTMPDSTSVFQRMIDNFGTAGTVAIAVIGAAVALGVIVILGMYGWKLAKKWLATSK